MWRLLLLLALLIIAYFALVDFNDDAIITLYSLYHPIIPVTTMMTTWQSLFDNNAFHVTMVLLLHVMMMLGRLTADEEQLTGVNLLWEEMLPALFEFAQTGLWKYPSELWLIRLPFVTLLHPVIPKWLQWPMATAVTYGNCSCRKRKLPTSIRRLSKWYCKLDSAFNAAESLENSRTSFSRC